MDRDYFRDKVALVSGASRGVGFALAKKLVERGAKVVITARGENRLLDSETRLKELGGSVVAVTGDVGKWEDAEKMVKAAIDNFGRLDIVVNNAGVSMRGKFVDLSPEVCRQVAETNLMGTIYLSRAAIPHIRHRAGFAHAPEGCLCRVWLGSGDGLPAGGPGAVAHPGEKG